MKQFKFVLLSFLIFFSPLLFSADHSSIQEKFLNFLTDSMDCEGLVFKANGASISTVIEEFSSIPGIVENLKIKVQEAGGTVQVEESSYYRAKLSIELTNMGTVEFEIQSLLADLENAPDQTYTTKQGTFDLKDTDFYEKLKQHLRALEEGKKSKLSYEEIRKILDDVDFESCRNQKLTDLVDHCVGVSLDLSTELILPNDGSEESVAGEIITVIEQGSQRGTQWFVRRGQDYERRYEFAGYVDSRGQPIYEKDSENRQSSGIVIPTPPGFANHGKISPSVGSAPWSL